MAEIVTAEEENVGFSLQGSQMLSSKQRKGKPCTKLRHWAVQ